MKPANTTRAARARIEALQLSRQLCFPLYAAGNLLGRLYRPLLDAIGLTYPQYLVMLALWERDARSVGELGETLFLDSGTLSPLLKRLEQAGLVQRRRAIDDERRVVVALTAQGLALRDRAADVPEAMLCRIPLKGSELAGHREKMWSLLHTLQQAAADIAD
ncbi:MAG: MarR family transcriptional regulator [Tahibacter sp.]